MKHIGSEPKDWLIEFRNRERPAEFLSQTKAQSIMIALKDKSTQYIERTYDDGGLLELIEKREIKRVYKPKRGDDGGKVWICDCGKRNPMSVWPASECGCDRNEYLKQLQLNINPQ